MRFTDTVAFSVNQATPFPKKEMAKISSWCMEDNYQTHVCVSQHGREGVLN